MRCELYLLEGFCSQCYVALRGRESGHRKLPAVPIKVLTPLEEEAMAMMRRDAAESPTVARSSRDEVLLGWLPTVHEWLTEAEWHDGKPRKTTTLMLVVENGRWKCWVHDRDARRSAWVTADAWEALWEVVEKGLKDDDLEWRKDTR